MHEAAHPCGRASLVSMRHEVRRVDRARSSAESGERLRSSLMKDSVSVTRERSIAAPAADIWRVVADPTIQERLSPRCRLESATGDWRLVNSEFTLKVRGARLRYVVIEADPGARWVAQVEHGKKKVGAQIGELSADQTGTLLRWTVTSSAGPLMRRVARRSCERELPRWLAQVEREVLATTR